MLYQTIKPYLEGKKGYEKVGILKTPKTQKLVCRNENGRTIKQEQAALKSRKVKERPSKELLLELIKTKTFQEVGKIYGVSDNTIRF